MTKADIVTKISDKTGMERGDVQAVVESYYLAEEQQSEYCRTHGIYPHHIQQWHKQLSDNEMDQQKLLNLENKRLKAENKKLLKKISTQN